MADSRAVLKTFFETGDIPTQTQFATLIDSLASLADTNSFAAANTHNADIILADASVLKALNGGGQFTTRSGALDGRATMTSDNDAQLQGFVIVKTNSTEMGFAAAADIFMNASGTVIATTPDMRIEILSTGILMGSASAKIGHFGATPIVKPTVTGSRAGNAALASLLSALDSLGLITDNST